MATIKTSELSGLALDWAVAQCEGDRLFRVRIARPDNWDQAAYLENGSDDRWQVRAQVPNVSWFADYPFRPSVDWTQAGKIIEREEISIEFGRAEFKTEWIAYKLGLPYEDNPEGGPTPLVAAMRCHVASKMGDIVEIPDSLIVNG